MSRISSFRETEPRYGALRVFGFLCRLGGAILMVVGLGLMLLAGYYALAARDAPALAPVPFAIGFIWSLGILISGLQLFALGAFFQLLIHLEENTRASAQALDGFRSRLEPKPDDPAPLFRT